MKAPFVIFGLPRSRTAWLAHWLAGEGRAVGHDIAIEADTVAGFLDSLQGGAGTVETGAMRAHRIIRHAIPGAQFITIRRPVADVADSLGGFGIEADAELAERDRYLDEIEADGAFRIEYDWLADVHICAALFELLAGVAFDFRRWQAAHFTTIQVDMAMRCGRVAERAPQIAAIKTEIEGLSARLRAGEEVRFPRIAVEGWRDIWPEAEPLAIAHSQEANAGVRHGHPFKMNLPLMERIDATGALRIVTARVNSRLAGYLFWTVAPDPESDGVTLATQGAWYVDPHPANRRLAAKMRDFSLALLTAEGVQSLQWHHQINGRGGNLGRALVRRGAIEHQHVYTQWIGCPDA